MYPMTHSHVRRDSFICAPWLIHMCDMTHPYVSHDSFTRVPWLIHMCATSICVTWLIHMYPMTHSHGAVTHSYVRHDSFVCAPWFLHLCDSLKSDTSCATHVMAHLYLSHGTPIFESWHTYIYESWHSYVVEWRMRYVPWVVELYVYTWRIVSRMCHEESHIRMSHVTHVNASRHTYKWRLLSRMCQESSSCMCTPRHCRLLRRMLFTFTNLNPVSYYDTGFRLVYVVCAFSRWVVCVKSRWVVCVGWYVLGGMCWVVCVGWYVLGGMCWVVCVGWYVLGGMCIPMHWRLLSRMLYIVEWYLVCCWVVCGVCLQWYGACVYQGTEGSWVVCRGVAHVVCHVWRWIVCALSGWVVCVYMKDRESYVSRGVTHMNESRHTCEWVTAHIWMRLLGRMCREESHPPLWSLVTSRIWIRHVTHVNASRPTCEWFMSRTWMHHNTHVNESRHAFVRIEKFTIARHVTHIKQVV